MAKYKEGGYSKLHLKEVIEICELRKSMDRPCFSCEHYQKTDCPEVIENNRKKRVIVETPI